MKFLKNLIIILISLILLVSFFLTVLAKSVNPETVKTWINTRLSTMTSMANKIDGNISWQLFPQPGIKITNIQIIDPENKTPCSLKIENLLLNLQLAPLLHGQLVFSELKVDGFTINLNMDLPFRTGKGIPDSVAENKANNSQAKVDRAQPQDLTDQFAIEKILLSHGKINLVYQDKTVSFSGLQIGAERLDPNQSSFFFQLKTAFNLSLNQKQIAKSYIQFKGSTTLSRAVLQDPLANLKSLVLDGQIIMQNLLLDRFKINRVAGHVALKNEVFKLNPLTISLYQGESSGNLLYTFANKKLQFNQTATGIDSAKLMNDLLQKRLFTGNMDLSLHTETEFLNNNWAEKTLGTGLLSIRDGSLESINLNKAIDITTNKINALSGERKPEAANELLPEQFTDPDFFKGSTRFKLLTIQYQIKNALLTSDSLVLQTDSLHLKGSGELNLQDYALNSHWLATVLANNEKIDEIQKLFGGNFPLIIKGTLIKPLVLPDLKKINPALGRLWFRENLKKPVQQIKHQIQTLLDATANDLN